MFPQVKRKKLILPVLVLAAGLVLFFYGRGRWPSLSLQVQKIQQGVQNIVAPVHRLWTGISVRYFSDDEQGNARLEAENAQLRQQLAALEEEKKTWEAWRGVRTDLIKDLPAGIPARVIAGDPSPQRRSVFLDKGSEEGLRSGQAVLAQGGLVGRLIQVSAHTSQVLLLTDPVSVVDVLAQESRARGTIKGGQDNQHLGGEYFLVRDVLQTGDLLLTSGQDGIFPKGIPVGIVKGLKKEETGIFYRAEVNPVVNLKKLEVVEVI